MVTRKPAPSPVSKLLRSDGALCITFANTGAESPQRPALESYADLLAWATETGALAEGEAPRLTAVAADHPAKASGAARKARTLTARLRRILEALARGTEPAATDLETFNDQLRQAMAARQLDPSGQQWIWAEADDDLDRMLRPVLLSAAELLTAGDRERIGRCPANGCGLFFIARSGGQPRKWCSVACRNRRSSHVHYESLVKPQRDRWARRSRF